MSFAALALAEVLGRWQLKGVAVIENEAGTGDPNETLQDAMQEYSANWEAAVARAPEAFGSLRPVLQCLQRGGKPAHPLPGLLRHPLLRASQGCSLPSCGRRDTAEGKPLRMCSGGCSGLSRYCCAEHAKAHWKQHKRFCKRQMRQAARTTKSG